MNSQKARLELRIEKTKSTNCLFENIIVSSSHEIDPSSIISIYSNSVSNFTFFNCTWNNISIQSAAYETESFSSSVLNLVGI